MELSYESLANYNTGVRARSSSWTKLVSTRLSSSHPSDGRKAEAARDGGSIETAPGIT